MSLQRRLVSFVVPAFNEAPIVESNLAELHCYAISSQPNYDFEIIVVDDGSTDETGIFAESFARRHPGVFVHHHPANRGLGAALQTGFQAARGDVIVTMDLDLSYAPNHIGQLVRVLEDRKAAMVLASPYMRGGAVANVPWLRKTLSAWANRFLSVATGGRLVTLTWTARAYDAAAVRQLAVSASGMDFNHEIVFAALRKKLLVFEIPARLDWRRNGAAASGDRRSSMKNFPHVWSVVAAGFRYRPSMLLTAPGLVPGLLPLVVGAVYLTHPSPAVIIDATVGTITVQLLSLGFFFVLTGSYVWHLRALSRSTDLITRGGTDSGA